MHIEHIFKLDKLHIVDWSWTLAPMDKMSICSNLSHIFHRIEHCIIDSITQVHPRQSSNKRSWNHLYMFGICFQGNLCNFPPSISYIVFIQLKSNYRDKQCIPNCWSLCKYNAHIWHQQFGSFGPKQQLPTRTGLIRWSSLWYQI